MMPAVASPPALSRSTATIFAPDFAKASAVARPMPFAAPVISATLPVKSSSIVSSSRLASDAFQASPCRPHPDHVLREDHFLLPDQRRVARRLDISGEQPDAVRRVRDDLGD